MISFYPVTLYRHLNDLFVKFIVLSASFKDQSMQKNEKRFLSCFNKWSELG